MERRLWLSSGTSMTLNRWCLFLRPHGNLAMTSRVKTKEVPLVPWIEAMEGVRSISVI